MNYEQSEMDRQLSSLIMLGHVAAVQMKPPRVRIESDGWTSGWVVWNAVAAGHARHWRPPSIGEQAVLLNPSGDPAQGVAIIGFYTSEFDGDGRPEVVGWLMPDGAVMEYDRSAGALLVSGVKTIDVKAISVIFDAQDVVVTNDLTIGGAVKATGDISSEGDVKAKDVSLSRHHHGGGQLPQ